ncbi:MAG: hypothetical protein R3B72_52270, partial [Polyangiaceae bacterium]
LARAVELEGDLITTSMETLRNLHNAGRLGVHVVSGIQDRLANHGLGHFPDPLPNYQHEEVRIYKQGTQVAKIVEAVLSPSDRGDRVLREAANVDTSEKLQKIRELICD